MYFELVLYGNMRAVLGKQAHKAPGASKSSLVEAKRP